MLSFVILFNQNHLFFILIILSHSKYVIFTNHLFHSLIMLNYHLSLDQILVFYFQLNQIIIKYISFILQFVFAYLTISNFLKQNQIKVLSNSNYFMQMFFFIFVKKIFLDFLQLTQIYFISSSKLIKDQFILALLEQYFKH